MGVDAVATSGRRQGRPAVAPHSHQAGQAGVGGRSDPLKPASPATAAAATPASASAAPASRRRAVEGARDDGDPAPTPAAAETAASLTSGAASPRPARRAGRAEAARAGSRPASAAARRPELARVAARAARCGWAGRAESRADRGSWAWGGRGGGEALTASARASRAAVAAYRDRKRGGGGDEWGEVEPAAVSCAHWGEREGAETDSHSSPAPRRPGTGIPTGWRRPGLGGHLGRPGRRPRRLGWAGAGAAWKALCLGNLNLAPESVFLRVALFSPLFCFVTRTCYGLGRSPAEAKGRPVYPGSVRGASPHNILPLPSGRVVRAGTRTRAGAPCLSSSHPPVPLPSLGPLLMPRPSRPSRRPLHRRPGALAT